MHLEAGREGLLVTTSKRNPPMRIERYKTINYTPALLLAMKAWVEAHERGVGDLSASVYWEQSGIVIFVPEGSVEVPAGVITWSRQPALDAVYVEQAWVEESRRGIGLFRLMWGDLVKQAKELGVGHIRLGAHAEAWRAHAIYEHMQGKQFSVFFEWKLGRDAP